MEIINREIKPVSGPDPRSYFLGPVTMLYTQSEPQHVMVFQMEKNPDRKSVV